VLVGETIASAFDKATRARILDARRAASLEALVAAGTTLQNETDGHRVGDLAVNLAVSVLDAVGAAVVLTDVDGAPVSVFSRLFDTTEATAIAATTPPVADGEPQWLDATLVVPLPGTVAPVGALIVAVKAEAVGDPFVAHAAQLFAAKAGAAIEQLRVLDALADAAVRDGLTGIGNRRHAGHLLDSLRPGDAVVVIDLDHFKLVNDEWGHGAGDRILIAVGQFLKGAVRDGDDVARLGGEEFLLVMRQPRDAAAAAERLVHQWRETRPVATCSAGVEMHSADRSPEETMHRADTALYWAKNSGRDRSVAAEDLPVEAFAGPISSFTEAPIAGLPR
jgi:diguanylate cyclase (GGDEF)-like protein